MRRLVLKDYRSFRNISVKMAEVTGRNPLAIRRRILEEFEKVQAQIATNPELWRKLSFEAHKELCTVLGANFIDYPEFEFWFSRFARGDFDLNYDKRFAHRVYRIFTICHFQF